MPSITKRQFNFLVISIGEERTKRNYCANPFMILMNIFFLNNSIFCCDHLLCLHFIILLGGGTHALHGSTSPPSPPPPSASPHLNLRGLVFNFKFKVSVALSFFLLRIFYLGRSLL